MTSWTEESSLSRVEIFGQMHGTYLFAQGRDGLYIIDQHAAQERVSTRSIVKALAMLTRASSNPSAPYLWIPADDALRLNRKECRLEEVGVFQRVYGKINLSCVNNLFGWQKKNQASMNVRHAPFDQGGFIKKYRAKLKPSWCPVSGLIKANQIGRYQTAFFINLLTWQSL